MHKFENPGKKAYKAATQSKLTYQLKNVPLHKEFAFVFINLLSFNTHSYSIYYFTLSAR